GEHRCQHRGLEHHREGEVSREAHADGADTGAAAFPMRLASQRAEPRGHRARFVGGEGAELGADTGLAEDGLAFLDLRHGAVAAEQRGHIDGEAGVADPAAEASDVRADARHLRHDDHRWPGAGDVHHLGGAVERDRAVLEIVEGIVLVQRALRHLGSPSVRRSAQSHSDSSTVTPSGPERKTSFRLWKYMISFRSWTPLALSLATSASKLSTAKQTWLNPSLVRLLIAGSRRGSG